MYGQYFTSENSRQVVVLFYAAVITLTRFNIKANEAHTLADNLISIHILM